MLEADPFDECAVVGAKGQERALESEPVLTVTRHRRWAAARSGQLRRERPERRPVRPRRSSVQGAGVRDAARGLEVASVQIRQAVLDDAADPGAHLASPAEAEQTAVAEDPHGDFLDDVIGFEDPRERGLELARCAFEDERLLGGEQLAQGPSVAGVQAIEQCEVGWRGGGHGLTVSQRRIRGGVTHLPRSLSGTDSRVIHRGTRLRFADAAGRAMRV